MESLIKPVITGIGLVTPLGATAGQAWQALVAGRYIDQHSRIDLPLLTNRALSLAERAAHEAIEHAGWTPRMIRDDRTALILATSKGPIENWLEGHVGLAGVGQLASDLSRSLGMGGGARLTFSAACASGLHALIRASWLISDGEVVRALVVGVEASVHPLFLGAFERLGILAPPGYGCRPFDLERRGFLMSEAAAAVCLERPTDAAGIVSLEAGVIGADAGHLLAADPSGHGLRRALTLAKGIAKLDLIHAHATATPANDAVEIAAIESVIDNSDFSPHLYSHKGALGHSLGAAGLVSVVINCLCHTTGIIPPNVRLDQPIPTQNLVLSTKAAHRPVKSSLALASGFGGALAVVRLASQSRNVGAEV